jgi:hypothetical protein
VFSPDRGDHFYLNAKRDSSGRVIGDEHDVKGEVEKAIAGAGKNWTCRYCKASNRAGQHQCSNCGGPKGEGTPYDLSKRVKVAAQANEVGSTDSGPGDAGDNGDGDAGDTGNGNDERFKPNYLGIGLAGAGAAAAGYGIYWGFQDHPVNASVTSGSWSHTVHLEEDRIVGGSGFQGELPGGAFNVRGCHPMHHHNETYQCGTKTQTRTVYDEVPDGECCSYGTHDNGNGSFSETKSCYPKYRSVPRQVTEQVPEYCERSIERDYCSYDIHQWIEIAAPTLNGGVATKGSGSLPWPTVHPESNQRTHTTSRYTINYSFTEDGKPKTQSQDLETEAEFLSWPQGTPATVYIRNFGGISHVERKAE